MAKLRVFGGGAVGSFASFACTLTVREVMRSSRTAIVSGETSTTFTEGFATVTSTFASCGSGRLASMPVRLTVACRSARPMLFTAPSGPASLTATSPRFPRKTKPSGTAGRSTGTRPSNATVTSRGMAFCV